MKSLPTRAILGAGTAILAAVAFTVPAALPLAIGLVSVLTMAVLASVAFAAQSERLREEQRLVYRPVYVRRHGVQRRVSSDDC